MDVEEVLQKLASLGNETRRQMYIKKGTGENTYGVLMGDLRKLASKIGKNHHLGMELWRTGSVDARLLSCMILDPNELSEATARTMAQELDYPDLVYKFTREILYQCDFAQELQQEWVDDPKEYLGQAGWQLLAKSIEDHRLSSGEIDKLLILIHNRLPKATGETQWAMNHAFCQIGINYEDYTDKCLELGAEMGVYREMKVAKGCTSAYAPDWIRAVVKKKKG